MKFPSHLVNTAPAPAHRPICVRPDQAAAMLGISRSTLDRLTKSGELDHVKLPRAKMYLVTDLEAFVDAKRIAGKCSPNPNATPLERAASWPA
jgi:excisionase family DNA binding protein